MTASSEEEASKIANALLEKELIACANIFPAHKTLYKWKGVTTDNLEVAVILKSHAKHFSAIEDTVKDLHSYDVPCLVQLPIEQGHAPFLDWISKTVV